MTANANLEDCEKEVARLQGQKAALQEQIRKLECEVIGVDHQLEAPLKVIRDARLTEKDQAFMHWYDQWLADNQEVFDKHGGYPEVIRVSSTWYHFGFFTDYTAVEALYKVKAYNLVEEVELSMPPDDMLEYFGKICSKSCATAIPRNGRTGSSGKNVGG